MLSMCKSAKCTEAGRACREGRPACAHLSNTTYCPTQVTPVRRCAGPTQATPVPHLQKVCWHPVVTGSSTGSLHTPHSPVSDTGLTAAAAASAPAPVPVAECTTKYGWSTACRAGNSGREVVLH